MALRSIPKARSLSNIFLDENNCLRFLKENGAFDIVHSCKRCGSPIAFHGHNWKCKKEGCRKQESFLKGSFFGNSRLPVNEIIELGYYWLAGVPRNSIMTVTGHSPNTITDYVKFYRELIAATLDDEDTVVGGPGIEVQVDETKFGKVKYHRGHRVDGVWIIGGVELTEQRKIFVKKVNRRNKETIVDTLQRHVLPGSIVVTDCWKGYMGLSEQLPVSHITVNHSLNFRDQSTGACTNHIEGTWSGLKGKTPIRNRTSTFIDLHLTEYIWRRKNENELWNKLLEALRTVGY
jgi:hypothetical protein